MTTCSSVAVERLERRIEQLEAALFAANQNMVPCPECGSADNTFWRGGESPSWECPCQGVIFDPSPEART